MSQSIDALTKALLHAAKNAGADSADAMAVRGTSVSVDVRGGALEQAERAEGVDIGLRVFVGKRSANVSASDTSTRTIEEMATRAVAMAKEAPEDPYSGLADPDQLSTSWDIDALELSDPTPEPSPQTLQDDAARAEAAGLAVKGISQIQSASAAYGEQQVYLAASNSFEGGYTRTDRGLSCVAIAGSGTAMERDYDGDSRIFQADLRSPPWPRNVP
jgi:PmbA protein